MDSNLSDNMLLMSVRDSNATTIQRAFRRYLQHVKRSRSCLNTDNNSTTNATTKQEQHQQEQTKALRCRTVQDRVRLLIEQAVSETNHVSRSWGGRSGIAHPWMSWAPYW